MAAERWLVDSYELTSFPDRHVESYDGLFASPAITGTNLVVPRRDGEVYAQKRLTPGSFALNIWLGSSSTPQTRDQIEAAWHRILAVCVKRHRLVTWTRYLSDGTVRECYGEVIGKLDPTPVGRMAMRAQIEVNVPSGCWYDTSDRDSGAISIGTGAQNKLITFSTFAGATAPMTALTCTITGTAQGLQIQVPETGEWFRYDVDLSTGQSLVVNSKADSVTAPDISKFRYKGPYLIELIPPDDPAVNPSLRIIGTNFNASATIRLQGRRAFLI